MPSSTPYHQPVRVGLAGVSGYAGVEILGLIIGHPGLKLAALAGGSSVGATVDSLWGGLAGVSSLPVVGSMDDLGPGLDAIFLALPHGVSAPWLHAHRELLDNGLRIVDLGADFRLRDPAQYATVYGKAHVAPDLLAGAVYGLPEKHRAAIATSQLVANPGCYPTATALAAMPVVDAGLAQWVVADCVSGVSGAGRKPGIRNLYCEVQESVVGYGLGGTHRHTPEIEQTLGVPVTFAPHLVPMVRGMLATVHMGVGEGVTLDQVQALFAARYAAEPAVVLRSEPPATGDVRGTGLAHVYVTLDAQRRVCTAQCAIDNLGKGAAAQAVQNLNVMLGLPEMTGVPVLPLLP